MYVVVWRPQRQGSTQSEHESTSDAHSDPLPRGNISNSLGKNRCEPEFLRTSSGKSKQVSRTSAAHAKLKECFEVLQGLKETVSPAAKSEMEAFLLKQTKTMEETKDLEMDPKPRDRVSTSFEACLATIAGQ